MGSPALGSLVVREHRLEGFGQRMAEAEHGLAEFEVMPMLMSDEYDTNSGSTTRAADVLVDGDVVVLGLGDDAGGLVELLAVPGRPGELPLGDEVGVRRSGRGIAWIRRDRAWMFPTRALCSSWNTWCTAVRPMFSLARPSPVMMWESSDWPGLKSISMSWPVRITVPSASRTNGSFGSWLLGS